MQGKLTLRGCSLSAKREFGAASPWVQRSALTIIKHCTFRSGSSSRTICRRSDPQKNDGQIGHDSKKVRHPMKDRISLHRSWTRQHNRDFKGVVKRLAIL